MMLRSYSGFAVVFAEDVPDVPSQDFTNGMSIDSCLWMDIAHGDPGYRRCLEKPLPHLRFLHKRNGAHLSFTFSFSLQDLFMIFMTRSHSKDHRPYLSFTPGHVRLRKTPPLNGRMSIVPYSRTYLIISNPDGLILTLACTR
jgi:hypothetical protein